MQIKKFIGENEFLSNHHASTIVYKGTKYKTVTHAYQSLKCKHPTDAALVRSALTPEDAVTKARSCARRDDWQLVCGGIMLELLRLKFENPFLAPRLVATGDVVLGDGRNFVGKLLMEVRRELNSEKEQK